jgi:hypothetical protein
MTDELITLPKAVLDAAILKAAIEAGPTPTTRSSLASAILLTDKVMLAIEEPARAYARSTAARTRRWSSITGRSFSPRCPPSTPRSRSRTTQEPRSRPLGYPCLPRNALATAGPRPRSRRPTRRRQWRSNSPSNPRRTAHRPRPPRSRWERRSPSRSRPRRCRKRRSRRRRHLKRSRNRNRSPRRTSRRPRPCRAHRHSHRTRSGSGLNEGRHPCLHPMVGSHSQTQAHTVAVRRRSPFSTRRSSTRQATRQTSANCSTA